MSQSIAVGHRPNFIKKVGLYFILIAGAVISFFPFYWIGVIATSDRSAVSKVPPKVTFSGELMHNFDKVLKNSKFFLAIWNSFFIATLITISVIIFCSLAGYAFAKYKFPLRKTLFFFVIATLLVPQQLSVLPTYYLMVKFHWIDTFYAIIVPSMVNAFGIFWMRQYIEAGVHNELLEAGKMDGCSHFRVFWNIVLPIIKPAMATLGIFTFLTQWNDFFWPLVILKNKSHWTIQIALQQLITFRDGLDYGMIMAGVFFATLPLMIIFLLFNKWFISGLTSGAIKS